MTKNTHKIVKLSKTYALGAYFHGGKLHAILVSEVGRYKNTLTSSVRVSDLNTLTSAQQLDTWSDEYPSDGRSIIGPYFAPKIEKNWITGEEFMDSLGQHYSYPSVATEDATAIIEEIKAFANSTVTGISPDEWSDICDSNKLFINYIKA